MSTEVIETEDELNFYVTPKPHTASSEHPDSNQDYEHENGSYARFLDLPDE